MHLVKFCIFVSYGILCSNLYLFRDNVTLALMLMLMPLGLYFTPFAVQPIISIDKDIGIKLISKFMSIYVAKCETWPKSSGSRSIKVWKSHPHIQGHLFRHVHTTSSAAAIFRSHSGHLHQAMHDFITDLKVARRANINFSFKLTQVSCGGSCLMFRASANSVEEGASQVSRSA